MLELVLCVIVGYVNCSGLSTIVIENVIIIVLCCELVNWLVVVSVLQGVEPSIRTEVWKFLLGYYDWTSTYKIRTELRKKKV